MRRARGTLEFEGLKGERIGYEQMLDELVETGYVGTELGDWGFMPTDLPALHYALDKRDLTMGRVRPCRAGIRRTARHRRR